MKKLIVVLLLIVAASLLVIFGRAQLIASLPGVKFKIVSEDTQEPLGDRYLYVYNGDYRFKIGPGYNVYPCDESAKKRRWFITRVRSDREGRFQLNIKHINAHSIYFKPGPDFRVVAIEKSSDLGHNPDDGHIRIVRFEKGDTRATRNDIYDVKRGLVKKIWLDGKTEEEPFEYILLSAQKN